MAKKPAYWRKNRKLFREVQQHLNSELPLKLNIKLFGWTDKDLAFLARSPETDLKFLPELEGLNITFITESLIKNPNITDETLKSIFYKNFDKQVSQYIFEHPNLSFETSFEIVTKIINDPLHYYWNSANLIRSIKDSTILELFFENKDSYPSAPFHLLANQNISKELKNKVENFLLDNMRKVYLGESDEELRELISKLSIKY